MQSNKEETKGSEREREINGGGKRTDGGYEERAPPLMWLNHASRLCRSVKESVDFYVKVLGFVLIERPQAFDFDGAWLFSYGVGIHLVQANVEDRLPDDIDRWTTIFLFR
ncbi:hypothetical protein Nepgr_029096 [Nepenthes gracilis]|uniref:Glyoxalase/fosfomycin resistance/dioxygenase domain-containing protein n=1 Tax=Nepenthes gracilis TaxID=150966 RepID=A0AAD3Y2Z7_NEPGR|nr:hypothetical protein Nepgr_029096 [Nepenthes gracilis]